MSNIRFLGIYEEEIDKAVNSSELALKKEGFTEKEIEGMNDMVLGQLEECGGDWSNITNSIIDSYFTITADLIRQRRKDTEVSYYVNGMDSHFYINGEEICGYIYYIIGVTFTSIIYMLYVIYIFFKKRRILLFNSIFHIYTCIYRTYCNNY